MQRACLAIVDAVRLSMHGQGDATGMSLARGAGGENAAERQCRDPTRSAATFECTCATQRDLPYCFWMARRSKLLFSFMCANASAGDLNSESVNSDLGEESVRVCVSEGQCHRRRDSQTREQGHTGKGTKRGGDVCCVWEVGCEGWVPTCKPCRRWRHPASRPTRRHPQQRSC